MPPRGTRLCGGLGPVPGGLNGDGDEKNGGMHPASTPYQVPRTHYLLALPYHRCVQVSIRDMSSSSLTPTDRRQRVISLPAREQRYQIERFTINLELFYPFSLSFIPTVKLPPCWGKNIRTLKHTNVFVSLNGIRQKCKF